MYKGYSTFKYYLERKSTIKLSKLKCVRRRHYESKDASCRLNPQTTFPDNVRDPKIESKKEKE